MAHVYSTASNDNEFPIWVKGESGNKQQNRPASARVRILIKGKANIIDQKTLITPMGVVTEVSDEALIELRKMKGFNRFVEDGFFTVEEKKVKVEKVVANMSKKDKSAQMTPKDFVAKNKNAPPAGTTEPTIGVLPTNEE